MKPLRLLVPLAALALVAGCTSQQKTGATEAEPLRPDYDRPLAPGDSALRLVTDPSRMPDLGEAYVYRDGLLQDAVANSLYWFDAPSSRQWFPFEGVTHGHARASVVAFGELLETARSPEEFEAEFTRLFDTYESVGYDGSGIVLFTGYFSPVLSASRVRTSRFTAPVYARPADLVTDPVSGEPQGRRTAGGGVVPYFTRAEIEQANMFEGNELYWLEDKLSAYICQVNGSAKLRLTDGDPVFIGYAGKTDRPYHGLGKALLDTGAMNKDDLSLAGIRRMYRKDPGTIDELILENENFVFFTEYDGGRWPAGSLGVPVTAEASLATDKKIYPRAGVVLVDTRAATFAGGPRRFVRFMLDQDTGGAIKAPGRADIFMGIGSSAEILAGGQYAEGRLYYFFLKDEHLPYYDRSEVASR